MGELKDVAGLMSPLLCFSELSLPCLLAVPFSSLPCFSCSPFPSSVLRSDAPSPLLAHSLAPVLPGSGFPELCRHSSGHLARSPSHLWLNGCQYKFGNKYLFHFSGLKMANIQVWKSNIMRLSMPLKRKDRLVNWEFSESDPKPNLWGLFWLRSK